ncbi:MAG: site-2 protease family protein, partial [Acidobacteriota bacterium]|nr:site-2 protease family protein [Acidobacteriota bacterium]
MLLTIAVTILVLGVLIFVHELGHFLAAKSVDIEVPRFSIGLGPKMFGFRRGETEYVISWIPLGGYVKMAGMADEEVTSKLEGPDSGPTGEGAPLGPRDFDAKPLWARTLVITAGVIMNWVFAIIAFAAIAMGEGVVEPRITLVDEGSPAEEAGLMEGDL